MVTGRILLLVTSLSEAGMLDAFLLESDGSLARGLRRHRVKVAVSLHLIPIRLERCRGNFPDDLKKLPLPLHFLVF